MIEKRPGLRQLNRRLRDYYSAGDEAARTAAEVLFWRDYWSAAWPVCVASTISHLFMWVRRQISINPHGGAR